MSSELTSAQEREASPSRPDSGAWAPGLDEHIAKALLGLRFGSIEIIVHDGKVVQIERREKLRLDKS